MTREPWHHAPIRPAAMPLAGRSGGAGKICLAAAPLAPRSGPIRDFRRARELARSSLVRFLLSRGAPGTLRGSQEVKVFHDLHGKPRLSGPHPPYPAVSFSYGMNCLWGAVGEPGEHLGLDVTEAGEFSKGYPYHRIAAGEEWEYIKDRLGRDKSEAAALLWAAKEAAVKALGCGYRGFGPLQVKLALKAEKAGVIFFCANIDRATEAEFHGLAGASVAVAVWRHKSAWLALGRTSKKSNHHSLNIHEA
ncbi:MAG: 4'-phosphopantetheinyl transferase superfamily protein [Deltaproteobacteria bacterium]|nr:4'-phosphopantetheinyl transferase superfamily protein [Deltaproteobacteria bacterium]